MSPGKIGECEGGVFDLDDEPFALVSRVFDSLALDEDAGCALRKDLSGESMCVMVGADDRDEERPGSRFATVDDCRCKNLIGAAAT
jgi:hypothetical protein